ncbi:limonene-1,2-epoxide hydrolase family protein [Tomitella fengzijianii]|uniref:Limonene-1,2-epoxide hydrolase n=1 Tax=Tomitella fengzijianii TaxID=2597660 RepID=A0A516WZG7_9ACTN|nr:limonene-1,2-epoxide hydrolase family protein [Tomitella fengzijianii]QDQ96223.1 limonene-1,2-epoxide hydrolase [Tomitella fengzijianii]
MTEKSAATDPDAGASGTAGAPVAVAAWFLESLAARDGRAAMDLVDEYIVYTNVGLATVRGERRMRTVVDLLCRPGIGFGVHTISAAADGETVLTERIDEIRLGRLRMRFWVCGKFVVRGGRITLWRDYFDFFDCTKAFLRALAGLVSPSLNRPMPG